MKKFIETFQPLSKKHFFSKINLLFSVVFKKFQTIKAFLSSFSISQFLSGQPEFWVTPGSNVKRAHDLEYSVYMDRRRRN